MPSRERIALILGLVLFFLPLVTPPPSGMSAEAWRMAGIAALMATWWIGEAIPLAVTALVPLVVYPVLGILPSSDVAREYGNHLIFLFLGGFMLAIAMERWGLHRRLAVGIIRRTGTRPSRLVVGFALSVAGLSMWISNTATALMILPVAIAVVRHLADHATLDGRNDEQTRKLAAATLGPVFMLTVAYAASAGGIATLVGTPPNIVLAGALRELAPDLPPISFARWMILGVPASGALLLLVLLIVPRMAAPIPLSRFDFGSGGREILEAETKRLGRASLAERRVMIVFALTVTCWLTRAPLDIGFVHLPGWSQLFASASYLHDSTVAIAAGLALTIFRGRGRIDGTQTEVHAPLLDWDTMRQRTPWGILLLFGGGFALARGFAHTGLSQWIGEQLMVLGQAPDLVLILGVCLLTTFLTEVTSNTATSTVLMPVLAATAHAIGMPPTMLMIPAALSASCAFMLPVATPPNAIVFGSGWVSIPQMARVGLVLNLAGAVVLSPMSWLLAGRLF